MTNFRYVKLPTAYPGEGLDVAWCDWLRGLGFVPQDIPYGSIAIWDPRRRTVSLMVLDRDGAAVVRDERTGGPRMRFLEREVAETLPEPPTA